MTLIQSGPPRVAHARRPMGGPGFPTSGYRTLDRSVMRSPGRARRPGPQRPAGAPMRYHGTGVAASTAPHRRRPVTVATTLGLAVIAGAITLWLGMVAHLGQLINGDSGAADGAPTLVVVRVEPGESLQELAARVAPSAPVRQEAERIRELNSLSSPMLTAGQTLIAPVG